MSFIPQRHRRLIVICCAILLALFSFASILSAVPKEETNAAVLTAASYTAAADKEVQLEQLGAVNLRLDAVPRTVVNVSGLSGMDWGDMDGDGDLDLAVPVNGQPSRVYLNDQGTFSRIAWTEPVTRASTAAAWGDVDGDGDLDLAVGSFGDVNTLYLNISGTLQATPVWTDTLKENTRDIKWGDMNGDGRLDLIVGNNGHANHIFANQAGTLSNEPAWSDENPTDKTLSIDIADVNGDQFLDFASGNDNNPPNPSVIYYNQANGTLDFSAQQIAFSSAVSDIAWGDVDNNGFPELAIVDRWLGGEDGFYFNSGGAIDSNLPQWQPAQLSIGHGVAWGDADNDGDLDLAIGSSTDLKERVYLNTNGTLDTIHAWESDVLGLGSNMVWVDFDRDDDQDLMVRYGNIIKVYVNRQWPLAQRIAWKDINTTDDTRTISLGDMNNDGLLDMAVGNFGGDATREFLYGDFGDIQGQHNRIYINSGFPDFNVNEIELSAYLSNTTSIAWGDVNGDGFLDLAVGNFGNRGADGEQNLIYINEDGIINPFSAISLGSSDTTQALAWGDVDGDGDLDLAVANAAHHPNKLYFNEGGDLTATAPLTFGIKSDSEAKSTFSTSLAWGDVDGDGDLDLAVGNFGEPNQLYLNEDGSISDSSVQQFGGNDPTTSVDWGDINADGRLDLAVGNSSDDNQLFLNLGGLLTTNPIWTSLDVADTQDVAWGDVDGDGDLDLAAANRRGQGGAAADKNIIYVNEGGLLQTAADAPWATNFNTPSNSVVWGDMDNDGDLDLVFGNDRITDIWNYSYDNSSGSNLIYWNQRVATTPLNPGQQPATIQLTQVWDTVDDSIRISAQTSPDSATAQVFENGRIAVEYILTHPENKPFQQIIGYFSFDGGGSWAYAQPVSGTVTTNLSTTPGSNTHIYEWDVFGSNIFGKSDNVIFRLEAYETINSFLADEPDTYSYVNQRAEAVKRPFIGAETTPIRIRGNQMRVFLENTGETNAIDNAVIYQIPDSNILNGRMLGNLSGKVYRTDNQGYLQGRTFLQSNDQLVALWPVPTETARIEFTNSATLYYMSASPITSGLKIDSSETITGIKSLVVSEENPLILYDLIVSLEWDARNDPAFMESLEDSFMKASEILFDVTNGQVMLGRVNVFHSKAMWSVADIVILANNGIRPSAAIGGVVNRPLTETILTSTGTKFVPNAYLPGQIRMGTAWDPFGENSAELTEDWYRALAHELSHYYFFLPDDYLGIEDGVLRRVNCQGSFMTTTRDPGYSEFLTPREWQGECLNTLAENTTGRTGWETITQFYPMLNMPNRRLGANNLPEEDGPRLLPLNLTHLVSYNFANPRAALPSRTFEVRDANNERTRLPNGQAYLIQTQGTITLTDDVLITLGAPTAGGDRIRVRGASPGDRLILLDESSSTDSSVRPQVGTIQAMNNTHVAINVRPRANTNWQPDIQVKSITSRTVNVTVTQSLEDGKAIRVQLYSSHYGSFPGFFGLSPTAVMTSTSGITHTATLTFSRPSYQTAVRIWVDDNSLRETITQFTLNPPWPTTAPNARPDIITLGEGTFIPLRGINTIPTGSPNNVAIGGPNNVAIGGPNNVAIGGPNNVAIGGPNNVAIGGPNNVAIGGPNNVAIGGPNNVAIGGPNNVAIGGPNNVAIGGPNNVAIGGPNNVAIGGPNNVAIGGPNNVAIGGPNNVPLGGASDRSFSAPILSADAQVTIYNNKGFFEDNGIEAMQVLGAVPKTANTPWLIPVGQAYHVTLNKAITDSRSIAFSYLQRDVPNGYEHTLGIYYLPDEGPQVWQRIPETQQYPENLVVAPVRAEDGTYAVMSTIEMPALVQGWNLLPYPLPVSRTINTALRAISGTYSIVYDPFLDGETLLVISEENEPTATNVEWLEFGRVYWIKIESESPVTPYLAPPIPTADGGQR